MVPHIDRTVSASTVRFGGSFGVILRSWLGERELDAATTLLKTRFVRLAIVVTVLVSVLLFCALQVATVSAQAERFRTDASLALLALALALPAIVWLRTVQRKHALARALRRDRPVRVRITRVRMMAFALYALLIAAGSFLVITDPSPMILGKSQAILVALVSGIVGGLALIGALLPVPPLTITAEGIAYPPLWNGTIARRSIKSVRIGILANIHVFITVDPPGINPLASPGTKLAEGERPVPVASFGIAAPDFVARIERERQAMQ